MPDLNNWLGLKPPLIWLLQRTMMLWVKITVLPADLAALGIDATRPLCYVLDLDGISNKLVLREVCRDLGLPDPEAPLSVFTTQPRATVFMRRLHGILVRRADPRISANLVAILDAYELADNGDVQFVPVSLFWGRAPQKEESLVKLLFTDSWSIAGRMRKLMIILLHGRNTLVQFSAPVSLKALAAGSGEDVLLARKLSRLLRVHFRRLREAAIGPDLSHRRLLVNEIIDSDAVRREIEAEAATNDISVEQARETARRFANEIAADYSHAVIRVLATVLGWLWNSMYDGIRVNHFQVIKDVAPGNEIVYVPCHRSHADYLLLSYVLYKQALVPPHIAAGINLNLPVVGAILRRGGAFFLRRSFRGQRLYSIVFDSYLRRNLSKGISIEYFVEGTRSRTGKLLDAKPGMLAMTIKSYLKDKTRPIVFVPVYFGYERLLEGASYEHELKGAGKKKESVWGLLKALRLLRQNFGRVYVNFGKPIFLNQMLDDHDARRGTNKQEEHGSDATKADQARIDRISKRIVPSLGTAILTSINNCAAVNAVNLIGIVLEATESRALDENDLAQQIELYVKLLTRQPYAPDVTLDEIVLDSPAGVSVIKYGEDFGLLVRTPHALGDIISLDPQNGRMLSYYRNNIKHLFAIPSLIACAFMANRSISAAQLREFTVAMYSLARGEYFLRWDTSEVVGYINDTVVELVGQGLISPVGSGDTLSRPATGTTAIRQLDLLAHVYYATVERYSVILNLLVSEGSARLRQSALEAQSRLTAERITMLNETAERDYFDARMFRRIVTSLLASGMVWRDAERHLCFGDELVKIDQLVRSAIDIPSRRILINKQ